MEDRETARMRKYGESKTARIMMAIVPHVTSGLGLRKFQADGFLLTRVYNQISMFFYRLRCFPNEHHPPPPPPLTFRHALFNLDTARCYATQNRSGHLGSRSIYSAKFMQCIAWLLRPLCSSVLVV